MSGCRSLSLVLRELMNRHGSGTMPRISAGCPNCWKRWSWQRATWGIRAKQFKQAEVARLEAPESSAPDKIIVLARFSRRRQRKVRLARPVVPDLAANIQILPDGDVETEPALDHPVRRRFAGIGSAIHQCVALSEVSDAAAKTHPRGNCCGGKQIQPSRRSHKQLFVTAGDDGETVGAAVQLFVIV